MTSENKTEADIRAEFEEYCGKRHARQQERRRLVTVILTGSGDTCFNYHELVRKAISIANLILDTLEILESDEEIVAQKSEDKAVAKIKSEFPAPVVAQGSGRPGGPTLPGETMEEEIDRKMGNIDKDMDDKTEDISSGSVGEYRQKHGKHPI